MITGLRLLLPDIPIVVFVIATFLIWIGLGIHVNIDFYEK